MKYDDLKIPNDLYFNRLFPYFNQKEYIYAKFEVNAEFVRLSNVDIDEFKNDYRSVVNQLIFPLNGNDKKHPSTGKIICQKIKSIAIWGNYTILLYDKEGNSVIFTEYGSSRSLTRGFEYNWAKLMRELEINLFPHMVNTIYEDIITNGKFEIKNAYAFHVYEDGIKIGNKFIELENIECRIDFKNWEVKISNRKNIFQRTKLGTANPNVIILPYLIDYLKLIRKL